MICYYSNINVNVSYIRTQKNPSFYKFLIKNALGKIELSQPRTLHQESKCKVDSKMNEN